jgi:hypothetical protein
VERKKGEEGERKKKGEGAEGGGGWGREREREGQQRRSKRRKNKNKGGVIVVQTSNFSSSSRSVSHFFSVWCVWLRRERGETRREGNGVRGQTEGATLGRDKQEGRI